MSASVLDDEEGDEDAKVAVVPEHEQGELLLDAFAVGGFGAGMKKLEMTMESEVEDHMHYLVTARKYAKIIDFDDHFHDVSLDWRNEEFMA